MNCPYCGTVNPEGAVTCVSCGQPMAATAPPAPPAPPEGYAPPPPQPGYAPPPAPPAPAANYAPQPYQQPYQQQAGAAVPVKNHMVMAILATLFCCLPLGVIGIVFASQVNGKLAVGDYAGAQKASKAASTWSWVAIGAGVLMGILYAAYAVFMVGLATQSGSF